MTVSICDKVGTTTFSVKVKSIIICGCPVLLRVYERFSVPSKNLSRDENLHVITDGCTGSCFYKIIKYYRQ